MNNYNDKKSKKQEGKDVLKKCGDKKLKKIKINHMKWGYKKEISCLITRN